MDINEQFDQMKQFIDDNLKDFAIEMVVWDTTSILKQDGYFAKASAMMPSINSLEIKRVIKEIISFSCVQIVAKSRKVG